MHKLVFKKKDEKYIDGKKEKPRVLHRGTLLENTASTLFLERVFGGFGEATDQVVLLNVCLAVLDKVVDALRHAHARYLRFAPQLFYQPPLLLQPLLKLVHRCFRRRDE